jgi:hemolysin III
MSHSNTAVSKIKPFSVKIFVINIVLSVSVYLAVLANLAPKVWQIQLQTSLGLLFWTFIAWHLSNAFLEHLFHRYILHTPAIPGMFYFYKSHTRHHALTHIVYKKITGVHNVYPIIEEKQHSDSFFPWYSYTVFALVLTGPMALVQWLLPTAPIFLGGVLALAWTISLYEILHAFEHKPLEKWIPKLEHRIPIVRKFWRRAYAFHLRHHADIKCNEGISGFFGIPIADFVFGTWTDPITLYTHGTHVSKKEFISPTPVFFIRWLDLWAEKRKQKIREKRK